MYFLVMGLIDIIIVIGDQPRMAQGNYRHCIPCWPGHSLTLTHIQRIDWDSLHSTLSEVNSHDRNNKCNKLYLQSDTNSFMFSQFHLQLCSFSLYLLLYCIFTVKCFVSLKLDVARHHSSKDFKARWLLVCYINSIFQSKIFLIDCCSSSSSTLDKLQSAKNNYFTSYQYWFAEY